MPSPTPMELPPEHVLQSMYDGGMSYAEMAADLGCSEGTIRRRMPSPNALARIRTNKLPFINGAATWDFEAPDWMGNALCAQTDPESFYPEKGGSTQEAKRVCMTCTVQTECLDYALEHQERFGIWGGLSERERRQISDDTKEPTPDFLSAIDQEEATA